MESKYNMLTEREKAWLLLPKALPSATHYENLRAAMPKSAWQKLRQAHIANANYECELCGRKNTPLHLHEMWEFDFNRKKQILTKLVVLCMHCHRLQHMMLLKIQIDRGEASVYQTLKNYNFLTQQKISAYEIFKRAAEEYQKYEGINWELDLGFKI